MGLLYGDTSGPSEAVRPLQDEDFMRRALALAARGIGFVSPNPTVGAVLVKDGQIVGEGWHERFGGPHAEVNAIRAAGHASKGATIYVTLEPCNHFGKTPPCTQAILSAGIKRVVIGTRDPNPKAAGGVEFLKAHGVTVEIDCLQQACRMLIAPFLKHVVTGLPWVISKAAMSLDGRIATRAGESKWITNDRSRACGHVLRAAVNGIVVGIGTVLADDPELTCRLPNGSANNPVRFVLDSTLKLPLNSRLCVTALQVRTVVVAAEPVSLVRKAQLEARGVEVWSLPCGQDGHRVSLSAFLKRVGQCGIQSLLIEGGAGVNGAFWDEGLVDEMFWFYAPLVIGGLKARTAIDGMGVERLEQALKPKGLCIHRIYGDILLHGMITDINGFFVRDI
jgi:diaminohydroxyphosphoribosylaminopyrimidine deaminase/5-amino-6-(5-phosphoribosylamino)uracil reductase